MTKIEIVEALIEATINGNNISKNETYKKMIKRISVQDIFHVIKDNDYDWELEDIGRSQKMDLIQAIVKRNF